MNKEFIPYEEALELKELGFDEKCFSYYHFEELSVTPRENGDDIKYPGDIKFDSHQNSYLEEGDNCSSPLYQQAFRWFREKYGLDGESTRYNLNNRESKILGVDVKYIYLTMINGVARDWEDIELKDATYYTTYEEAELACLRQLIKIENQNKDE